jgi:hypothetical protein
MPNTTGTSTPRGRLLRPAVPNPDDPLGLFGDCPPTWTINKGKLGQRPSSSAAEAMKQRDATVFKLRRHANHVALLRVVVGSSTFGLCSNTAANRSPVAQADSPAFNHVPLSRSRF